MDLLKYKKMEIALFQVLLLISFILIWSYCSSFDLEIAKAEQSKVTLVDSTETKLQVCQTIPTHINSVSKKHSDYEIAVWLCKSYESLRLVAYWDVTRWSKGWATIANKGDTITLNEANLEFQKSFNERYEWICRHYPNLDRWTALIYTNTYYNAGSPKPDLQKALTNNDTELIAKLILNYNKAPTKRMREALLERRKIESAAILYSEEEKQEFGTFLKQKVIKIINKYS